MRNIRIAIVHDWLTGMRGGEKCLEVFCELFPDAILFTLLHDKGSVSPLIEKMDIRTSFLQKIPGVFKKYRQFLPFFPAAVERFDLSGYDLILSSSHCVAKGARVPEEALHICYCYTPMRYAWTFFDEYFSSENPLKRWVISKTISRLKKWDIASNKGIDHFVAISDNVKNRIKEIYDRQADVIYPPAEVGFRPGEDRDEGFYLVVSALVPYKRVDIAVKAFNNSGRRLVVVGKGTELERLKKISNKNIEFLGWASDEALRKRYAGCSALVFPGVEDFGIVPVEAQAHGKPVIAYAKGGVLETVTPSTGVFFHEQSEGALNEAIDTFESSKTIFEPEKIRKNAQKFNRERFKQEIKEYVEQKLTTNNQLPYYEDKKQLQA